MAKRYNSKRIARSPALKRKIAEVLAQNEISIMAVSAATLTTMFAYGHRGFISYNDDELCKLFDKLFTEKLADAAERRKNIEALEMNVRHSWQVSKQEKALKEIETSLTIYREIADELFEAKFLS